MVTEAKKQSDESPKWVRHNNRADEESLHENLDSTLSATQPEVVVVTGGRREMYVGYPTVEAIVGDKISPGLADWYLARNGYDAQQTEETVESDRRDNLWDAVPGDHGAHGTFGDRATASSPQLWASKNRNWLALAGAGVAGVLFGTFLQHAHNGVKKKK